MMKEGRGEAGDQAGAGVEGGAGPSEVWARGREREAGDLRPHWGPSRRFSARSARP